MCANVRQCVVTALEHMSVYCVRVCAHTCACIPVCKCWRARVCLAVCVCFGTLLIYVDMLTGFQYSHMHVVVAYAVGA